MTRLIKVARPSSSPEKAEVEEEARPAPKWNMAKLIAFRFCLVYIALFFLSEMRIMYPLLGVFGNDLPPSALTWQYHGARPFVNWVADRILHVDASLIEPVQSGDQAFFWVLAFTWFLAAAVVTLVWSLLDRRRGNHVALHKWLHLVVRLCLAAQLFSFGFAKVFPLQMSLPLTRLVEPFGNFAMLNVLWSQVGSSQPYEILLGCAEVTAGLLLVVPRTAMLGALLASVELTQVLILNATYQVPLKIFTFHLLLLSLFVLAPYGVRLVKFFVLNQSVGPFARPPLFQARRAAHLALAAQLLVGAWLVGSQVHEEWKLWDSIGSSGPKPPLYGIWNVTSFSSDGRDRPPLVNDAERWNRLIVDTPHSYQDGPVSSQRMDGSIVDYMAVFDASHHTITLARADDPKWAGRLTFEQSTADQLTLDGLLGGHKVRMQLQKVDLSSFPVTHNGVEWEQDGPSRPRLNSR
ncbi:DoxX family protein [Streptomyces sp. NPDC004629]|uniref:DoxX family protein n=1 Tax=Streptomyces sp. NPDC004629 TaxID=3364705 RepID=UPI0036AB6E73